ncbi:MAG: transposase [Chloroflexota bacterium]|nr:transposase [Chloroflexota bacterium]
MERKAYQFRLAPTKGQRRLLEQTLDTCRWVYNETLAYRKQAWEERQEPVGLYDTNALLPVWKDHYPELKQVYSQVLQDVQNRVHLAFDAFFRRIKQGETPGYPRFRGKGWYDSFTFKQAGFGFKVDGHWLDVSKIGRVKLIDHRPIDGTIKTLTIRRTATGKWFACFSVEVAAQPLPHTQRAVGIDVGLEMFATLSTGEQVVNPRFFRKDERELATAQRKLSKAEQGTPERHKRRKVVAHIHERIANRRKDFAHKLSRRLVNEFGIIVVEDLNIARMIKHPTLAKSIADAAWNQFANATRYKAANAGRTYLAADPRGTSQRCSRCSGRVKKALSVRVHQCPHCGLEIDRDLNAALNILAVGLHSLGENPSKPPVFRPCGVVTAP